MAEFGKRLQKRTASILAIRRRIFRRFAAAAQRAALAAAALSILCLAPSTARAQGTGGEELEPPFVECCKNNSEFANLRAGPNASDYDIVGILTLGEKVKAIGQSKAGLWIQIRYQSAPGGMAWVSADLVIIHYGPEELPIVNPPPTPIPKNQPTIDPTFAAQFSSVNPTRLPTFTPATPAATITIPAGYSGSTGRGLPPAMIILALLTIGTFGTILSAMVGRR
jgi:hypothetical protein